MRIIIDKIEAWDRNDRPIKLTVETGPIIMENGSRIDSVIVITDVTGFTVKISPVILRRILTVFSA